MGGYPVNPVLQGLTTAMGLADMLHRQRISDQQVALETRRVEDAEKWRQMQDENQKADLSMRLSAIGARQMTPSDELEANTGQKVSFTPTESQYTAGDGLPQTAHTLAPSIAPSDLKSRLVKAGGQQWVLPSEDDRAARADRESERETRRDVAKTKATTQAKIDTEIAGKQAALDKFGIPISDEHAALLGIPKGSKIQEEHLDDYVRSIATAKTAELQGKKDVRSAIPMYGEKESGVAVIMNDGSVKWNPIEIGGQRKTPESANSQRLAEKDALGKLVEETASNYATQFPKYEDAEAALKTAAQSEPFIKKNYLSILKQLKTTQPKAAAKPAANSSEALLEQMGKLLNGEETAPAASGKTPAAPAAKKPAAAGKGKADGAKLRAYAQRYKIPFAEAVAQAKKEGFDVSGLEAK